MEVLLPIWAVQLMAVISPGPSFLITVRTAVAGSQLDGIKVALGLAAGAVTWAGATVLGLHLLFQQSPWLYLAMKIGGALYLLWIAVQMLRFAAVPLKLDGPVEAQDRRHFARGYLTQISNPKVVVFFASIFMTMLPNDVPTWMSLVLIAMVGCSDLVWYSIVALFFGAVLSRRQGVDRPRDRPRARRTGASPAVGRLAAVARTTSRPLLRLRRRR
jgi:threonine/homoserine/homoserine lactone efflux protein